MSLTHADIWAALDALAERKGTTPSGLARAAGLDPTAFNPSKRQPSDRPPRPRWPTTESVAKVLAATGVGFAEFAALADRRRPDAPPARGVPLIGFAQAGAEGYFDDAGFPVGQGWDEIAFPGLAEDAAAFALEISGDSMSPLYRDGDRIIVDPTARDFRRGDRVVVRTAGGEVMAKELVRLSVETVELASLNPDFPGRTLARKDVAWMARILWASQ